MKQIVEIPTKQRTEKLQRDGYSATNTPKNPAPPQGGSGTSNRPASKPTK